MSFYDDASLVFLAGGAAGKDGKAYSLKPTDGSGDFTFTRGTNLTATRVGKDGYIEKGRENLLLQSNQFDTSPWTFNGTLTGGQTGYDGSSDAWLISNNITTGPLGQARSYSGVQTLSAYFKKNSTYGIRLYIYGTVNTWTWFDLNTGEVEGYGGNYIDSSIEAVGDDWWRCSMTFDTTTISPRFYVTDNAGTQVLGNVTIQDAQLEYGLVATDYIETGSSTATAGLLEDEPRFDYTGGGCPALLMEPTRTNLVKNSEYLGDYSTSNATITTNALTSPEGLDNATTIDVTSNSGSVYAQSGGQVESVTAETEYTFSFYVKQGTNTENYLAVRDQNAEVFISEDVAYTASTTEWKRISHTFTTPVGCTSIRLYPQRYSSGGQGTTHIWGMQLEAGDYATSYIPTYGSSATRAKESTADSFDQINTLDLSSSGLDGEDVSWFFELRNNQDVIRDGPDTTIRVSSNTSNLGSFRIYRASSGVKQLTVVFQDAVSNFTPSGYEMTSENPKVLVKRTWSTGRIQVYVDGASVIDGIDLDYNAWYKLDLSGEGSILEVKQVLAFPMVLSDNDSEILTGATSYSSFATMATSTALNYTIYE